MSKDRPAGMDDGKPSQWKPTDSGSSSNPKTSMSTVASVAAGRVDSGPKSSANMPSDAGKF